MGSSPGRLFNSLPVDAVIEVVLGHWIGDCIKPLEVGKEGKVPLSGHWVATRAIHFLVGVWNRCWLWLWHFFSKRFSRP